MQPQQPYYQPPSAPSPQAPPPGGNQYDFIMSPGTRRSGPTSRTVILFVAGAALLVVLLAWLILSLALGGKGGNTAPLIGIAQQQAEIVRITKLGADSNQLSSQDARNFSRNTQMTITSDQVRMMGFLAQRGTKISDKQLAAKHSAATDNALSAAQSSGTYDSTLVSTLQTQLKTYQASLGQAFSGTKSSSEQALLKAEYNNATLLLEQSNQRN